MPTIEEVTSGQQTAVISTTHQLDSETDAGTYMLVVDLSEMESGDEVILRVRARVRSGSAGTVVALEQTFTDVQDVPCAISEPLGIAHEVIFNLRQTAGTGRSFEWSVLRVI